MRSFTSTKIMKSAIPYLCLLIVFSLTSISLSAQEVGINTTNPDPLAALDVVSTDQGLLIPRGDTTAINSKASSLVVNIPEGLMVFQNSDKQIYHFDGAKWISGTGGSNLELIDGDGDTKVYLDENTQDHIGFMVDNTLQLKLTNGSGHNSFRLEMPNNGNNIAIGTLALYSNTTGVGNIANGREVLYSNTTGSYNIANGLSALGANTTGSFNIANGSSALGNNTSGFSNIANGPSALRNNTIGNNNIANGTNALFFNTEGNHNIANGSSALLNNTEGNNNIANGNRALTSNTTGSDNIANGLNALKDNTSGNNNIANGLSALFNNTTGNNNIAHGNLALLFNTTGSDNIAIGDHALYGQIGQSTGDDNIAIGDSSLFSNTIGYNNIAQGKEALYSNTSGYNNIANGGNALYFNTTGNNNIANGRSALVFNTTGSDNIAIGDRALYGQAGQSTGDDNIAIGDSSLFSNTTGHNNIAQGKEALYSNTTGFNNIAFGNEALYSNTTGSNNIANGNEALYSNTTGSYNIANGNDALSSNTIGNNNIANGRDALKFNTTGSSNIANGIGALRANINGSYNTANGESALLSNTSGSFNIANGLLALKSNTIGSSNIANGRNALKTNTTGSDNIAFGENSGLLNSTGSNNIFLGRNAGYSESGSNKLYIENTNNTSTTLSTSLIYGDFNSNVLRFNAEVGIGMQSAGFPLSIEATIHGDLMKFYDDNEGEQWHVKLQGTNDGDLGFTESGVENNRLVLKAGGRIGIGTATPKEKLHVNGGAWIQSSSGALDPSAGKGIRIFYDTGPNQDNAKIQAYDYSGTGAAKDLILQGFAGDVGIGTSNLATGHKLSVNGKIAATEVRVQPAGDWPDYVFAKEYELMNLNDLEASINKHKHLPNIPSADEVKEEGIQVGDMQIRMMEKIEELTLYIIDLNKEIEALKAAQK